MRSLLAAPGDRAVVVLSRRPDKVRGLPTDSRIRLVGGDITRPNLGLDLAAADRLRHEATAIIHCAAETRFGLPIAEARVPNVRGTENVLTLARACRRLEKFAHVSTVYVAGRTTGRIPESAPANDSGFVNTYQESKHDAERVVLAAMVDIPAVIYRLSTIVGDSSTGQVRQYNYFHQLLRLFARNVLPVVPGDLSWEMDLIPTDWAIAALAYLIEQRFVPGDVLHVCAGAEASPKMSDIRDTCVPLFEAHPRLKRWMPLRQPRFVPLAEYEAYVEETRRTGDALLVRMLHLLNSFMPQMGIEQRFDDRQAQARLAGSGLHRPEFGGYFHKIIRYCLDVDWGRAGGDAMPGER